MLKSISKFYPFNFFLIFKIMAFDSRRFSLYFHSSGASPTIASASIKHRLVIDRKRIQKLKLTWPTSLFFRSPLSRLSFRNIKKNCASNAEPYPGLVDKLEFMMKFCRADDGFWRFNNVLNIHVISFN